MLILSDEEFIKWYHSTSEDVRASVNQLLLEDLSNQESIDSPDATS